MREAKGWLLLMQVELEWDVNRKRQMLANLRRRCLDSRCGLVAQSPAWRLLSLPPWPMMRLRFSLPH